MADSASKINQSAVLKDRAILEGVQKLMPKDLTQTKPGGTSDPAPRDSTGAGSSRGDRQGSVAKSAPKLSAIVRRANTPPSAGGSGGGGGGNVPDSGRKASLRGSPVNHPPSAGK